MNKKCVVLLSGGLDSSTCLAVAKNAGYDCFTLSIDYGQRHLAELNASTTIANSMSDNPHKVVQINLDSIGGSALTDSDIDVPDFDAAQTEIPVTYVPARNTIFLSTALAYAEVVGAQAIYIGVTAVDYSGYPDCRAEYIQAFETMANLATKAGVEGNLLKIVTPLIDLDKAKIIQLGDSLGFDYSQTVSCYSANAAGEACGVCDSCHYRRQGFKEAGIDDPTRYVVSSEQ
ncbi:7-cyano-7-deazaguanine synthase QueC [Marinicella sp. S1101]|uniref:7-cyano-7-deazaguanine synthase QueC n=1 Tax=Marinicella marina TaxID=2996016 RepID=UPI00226091D4|nr:7-cyano-7-deazaguanine synthase QueC [Marinicella marina]MCX7552425.1 7-cyano-7-deazaguanine synthase QueC [Marinicella marina]MDJ1139300.1 7-cyano-7-deazaguanine synthase QueC [Marinicella marina]